MPSFRLVLAVLFVLLFALSAIRPLYPQDFLIEHILTVVGLGLIVWADRTQPLSKLSLALVFAFLLLHLLGAHYTYSEVPYDRWCESLFGASLTETLGWSRNHYDRLVHLSFGLLMIYPARELLARMFPELRPLDGRLLLIAILLLAVLSKIYELLEWGITLVMTEDAAATYNGEQGDRHDAHKDMALALVGAVFSAIVVYVCDASKRKSQSG